MQSRVLVAAFMVLSVVALNLSAYQPVSAVPDFCADCAQKCWNDANTGENNQYYWECVDERGDTPANREYCYDTVVIGYYNGCIAIFCNASGCRIVRKAPTSRPGDN